MNYDEWLIAAADRYWSQRLESNKDQNQQIPIDYKATAEYYRKLNESLTNHLVNTNKMGK